MRYPVFFLGRPQGGHRPRRRRPLVAFGISQTRVDRHDAHLPALPGLVPRARARARALVAPNNVTDKLRDGPSRYTLRPLRHPKMSAVEPARARSRWLMKMQMKKDVFGAEKE